MKHPTKTPPFRGPTGEAVPGSIAEAGYLALSGLDQWVMIRGESQANPPLIMLHGGPGMSETFFFRRCNAPLEKGFTVVYWDQRGSGKSFHRSIPWSSMTVERFIADLDELMDAVREGGDRGVEGARPDSSARPLAHRDGRAGRGRAGAAGGRGGGTRWRRRWRSPRPVRWSRWKRWRASSPPIHQRNPEREATMACVLVVYGTTEGHTRKVAHYIAQVVRDRGHRMTVLDASLPPDPGGYDAVIVAASVHQLRHQSAVIHFAQQHRNLLNSIPTAFFSVSLSAALGDPHHQLEAREVAEQLLAETRWRPLGVTLVGGALLYSRYDWLKRLLMQMIARHDGRDTDTSRDWEYTDWDCLRLDVDEFLREMEESLARRAAGPVAPVEVGCARRGRGVVTRGSFPRRGHGPAQRRRDTMSTQAHPSGAGDPRLATLDHRLNDVGWGCS